MRGSTDKSLFVSLCYSPYQIILLFLFPSLLSPSPSSQLGTMHASFCVVCFHGDGRWICRQLRSFSLFSSIRPSWSVFFSFFFIFPLLRPRGRGPLLSARRLPCPAPRGFSFSCLEPERGLLSVRTQPLAYNESENLRGTQGMRRMITYIETKNRPTRRRSAALLLSLSVVLPPSSPSRPKTPGHLAKRAIAARIKRSDIVTRRFVFAQRMLWERYKICYFLLVIIKLAKCYI